MPDINVRPARSSDQAYVANSWVSSIVGPRSQWGDKGAVLNSQVDRLLDDRRTKVLVACEPSNHEKIIGWIATARVPGARVLEYVHVRRHRRREGIATQLMRSAELLGGGPPLTMLFDTADRAHLPKASAMTPQEFLL